LFSLFARLANPIQEIGALIAFWRAAFLRRADVWAISDLARAMKR